MALNPYLWCAVAAFALALFAGVMGIVYSVENNKRTSETKLSWWQIWWPALVFAAAGIGFLIAGLVIASKRRQKLAAAAAVPHIYHGTAFYTEAPYADSYV